MDKNRVNELIQEAISEEIHEMHGEPIATLRKVHKYTIATLVLLAATINEEETKE